MHVIPTTGNAETILTWVDTSLRCYARHKGDYSTLCLQLSSQVSQPYGSACACPFGVPRSVRGVLVRARRVCLVCVLLCKYNRVDTSCQVACASLNSGSRFSSAWRFTKWGGWWGWLAFAAAPLSSTLLIYTSAPVLSRDSMGIYTQH
jgi:hypothetical protein